MIIVILIIICIAFIFFDHEEKRLVFTKSRKSSLIMFLISGIILFIGIRGGGPLFTTIGSIIALVAAFMSRIIVLLPNIVSALMVFPFFKKQSNYSKQMTKEEAREILGVNLKSTKEEVTLAYKKAIAKNHPDQGGSTYLAAKINEAKKILLD